MSLQRILIASTEKVYRAFTEVNKVAVWLPHYGLVYIMKKFNEKRRTFQNFGTGYGHSFGGKYLAVKPY